MRSAFVLLLAATLQFAPAQPAAAAPSSTAAEARAHFVAGESLYRDGNWTDALAEFRAGYALDPRPEFLINVAQTQRRLGQLDEALRSCQEFLARAPKSPLVAAVKQLTKELRADRAAARAQAAAADGAQLFAAAQYERALEAYQRAYLENIDEPRYLVAIGDCYRALARKPEALRFYRLFLHERPRAAERAAVEAKMHALEQPSPPPPPAPSPPSPPIAATPPAPLPVAATLERPAPARPKRALVRQWWLWTTIGGAVAVGVGLGVGLGVHRTSSGGSFMPTLPAFGPKSQPLVAPR